MVYNFLSAIIVHSTVRASDVGLVIEDGPAQLGVHHAGNKNKDHSRSGTWFYGIGCALIPSALMIYPAALAELILYSSPRHALLEVIQVTSWIAMKDGHELGLLVNLDCDRCYEAVLAPVCRGFERSKV